MPFNKILPITAWAALLLGVLLWAHWPHIESDALLSYDDQILVVPLKNIGSVSEYLQLLRDGKIWERQPIKDFSIMLDYRLMEIIPFWKLHLTNVLTWYFTSLVLFFICSLYLSPILSVGLASVFAVHPLALNCIGWVAARKHLLAALFVTLSTFIFLRALKKKELSFFTVSLIAFLFILAGLSQMIVVAYPAWVLYQGYTEKDLSRRSLFICVALLGIISVSLFAWNLDYYTNVFPTLSGEGGRKFAETSDDTGFRVIALGAYFSRIFFPFWPSTTPVYPGSVRNIVGLVGLVVFFYLLYKLLEKRNFWSAALYIVFPLLPVTIKITNVYASGTYLLNSMVGVAFSFALVKNNYVEKFQRAAGVTFLCLFLLFATLTRSFSHVWTSDFAFWSGSAEAEPNAQNLMAYGRLLLEKQDFSEAHSVAARALAMEPDNRYVIQFAARTIYLSPNISLDEKTNAIQSLSPTTFWRLYYLAFLSYSKGDFKTAYEIAESGWHENSLHEIKPQLEEVTGEFVHICALAKAENCAQFEERARKMKPKWKEDTFATAKKRIESAKK